MREILVVRLDKTRPAVVMTREAARAAAEQLARNSPGLSS